MNWRNEKALHNMFLEVEKDIDYILKWFLWEEIWFDIRTGDIIFENWRMYQYARPEFYLTKLTTWLDIAKYWVVTNDFDSPYIREMYDFYSKVFWENRMNNWKSIIRISRHLWKDFFVYFYKNFIRNKTPGTKERQIYLKYFITEFRRKK